MWEVEEKLQHKLQQKTCDSDIFYSKTILFIWSLEFSPTIRKLHSGKYPPPLFRLKKTHVSCDKFCNLLKQAKSWGPGWYIGIRGPYYSPYING